MARCLLAIPSLGGLLMLRDLTLGLGSIPCLGLLVRLLPSRNSLVFLAHLTGSQEWWAVDHHPQA